MRAFIYTKVLLLPVCSFCNKVMGLSRKKHLLQHVEHMIHLRCSGCVGLEHPHRPCYHPHCLCSCSHK